MTDTQLYLAIGVPIVANFAALLLGFTLLSSRISDTNGRIDNLRAEMIGRIDDLREEMIARFESLERLFDAKLRRLEEVLDARLKDLEER